MRLADSASGFRLDVTSDSMVPPRKRPYRSNKEPPLTLADVRRVALGLPETSEAPSYGTPAFRVRKKLFARMLDDGLSIVVKCDFDHREFLVESRPDVFSVTPHYLAYPMVVVQLATVGRDLLSEILAEAWRHAAPPKLGEQIRSGDGEKAASKRSKITQ